MRVTARLQPDGCLAVYVATLAPGLSYKSPDGNEPATLCYTLGLPHSPGYPLYTWLGKLFTLLPAGQVAHRVNLMSAMLGAAGDACPVGKRPAARFGGLDVA